MATKGVKMSFAEQQRRAHLDRQRRLGKIVAPVPLPTVAAPPLAPQPQPRSQPDPKPKPVVSPAQEKMIESLQQEVARLTAELMALAREDASPLVASNRIKPVIRAVAKYYGVSVADLISRRRSLAVTRPRQTAMFLVRTLTDRSLPAIGRVLHRDHGTVLHGCRKIAALRVEDPKLDAEIRELIGLLTQGAQHD
jgi:hypothetical protein